MGKLLSGRYGEPPIATSSGVSLTDCYQKLGLKPSDFVSQGEPTFFEKSFGAKGKYLLFQLDAEEAVGKAQWKPGYYLLPLEAADVLDVLKYGRRRAATHAPLPVHLESDVKPPAPVVENAQRWAQECQPLFFQCPCTYLELRLKQPWGLRRHWKARLRCPDRCQPALEKSF